MEDRTRKPPTKWHAVTVVVRTTSCAAATLCRNVRHLAAEAPRLPLPNCDRVDECECTFRHHVDRRTGKRRTDEVGVGGSTKREVDRRLKRGRRANDR